MRPLTFITEKKGYYVYAVDIDAGQNLLSLSGPKCQIGRLDVASIESIREFKIALGDQKVNVLLNVAGKSKSPLLRTKTQFLYSCGNGY